MSRAFARRTVAAMLMLDKPDELADGDLIDAVGELTNMIGGSIKTSLFQKTPLFDISVPSVYIGQDLQRRSVSEDLCFLVPFRVDDMEFSVEFLMVTKKDGGTGVQQAIVDAACRT
jgi:chemotaxis protein CheX